MKTPQTLLLALFLGLCLASHCEATIYNSDGSAANVQALTNIATDGDTIAVPAGTFTWAVTVTITKAITLQGSGVGNTIVRDAGSGNLINWNLVAGKPSRMTGIEFRDGGRTVAMWGNSIYGSNTNGSTMRIDNCKFDHLIGFAINPNDVIGVIDHNTFLAAACNIPIYAIHKNWNDQGPFAGGSWHDSSHFGTSQFLFIEDNTFAYDATPYAAFDCYGGTRIVFRYNNLTRAHCEIHGTDSAGIMRGGRAFEIYNNTFTGPTGGNYVINGRSGVFVVHDNQTTGISDPVLQQVYYRSSYPYAPWGAMDGSNPWDVNDTSDHTGNGFGGGPNGLYASYTANGGTPNGGSYGFPTVTVAGSPWTANQWKGYSIKKTSAESGTQKASYVFENTSNTITFLPADFPPTMQFSNGSTFQLYWVMQALDQPGRSQGSLVSQTDPPTVPGGWNDQVTEPSYEWNNTMTEGGTFHFVSSPYEMLIRENEHFFNGTQAPGYTPYTYPHPLVSGQPTPTPTPTATAIPTSTPTPTTTPIVPPTPVPCRVPNLIGAKINRAQSIWNAAGFIPPSSIAMRGPNGRPITWESLPAGSFGACAGTAIAVQSF